LLEGFLGAMLLFGGGQEAWTGSVGSVDTHYTFIPYMRLRKKCGRKKCGRKKCGGRSVEEVWTPITLQELQEV
jgi:hypothetical protein